HGDHDRYHDHPYLSLDAAGWLVVLDVATPDQPERHRAPGFGRPAHHRLRAAAADRGRRRRAGPDRRRARMTTGMRVAVLGGGHGALATAADLALRGHQVTLALRN